ncbi:MAG: hypothetical protein RJA59_288, partial [Pseudomonadota bacterium]
MAGGARVVIGADVKEVQPAIDSVVRSVQQGATQVGGAFQGWVGNSNAVASATEKLERQLKGFASEQRTQGRMARFYAGEIASIIPAASGARSAIEGLAGVAIEGIAGGLSLGLAFESVKLVIGAVTAAMAEAAQRMKDMEAASLTAAAGISAAADALERMKRPAESMAQKAFREVFDAGTKGAKDLTDQIEKLRPSTMQLVWAFMWDGSVGMKRLNDEFATAARNLDTMTAAARKYATEAAALFPDAEVAGPGNDIGAGKFAVNNEKATKARERAAAAAAEEARAQKKIADELERSLNAWMQMAGPGNMAGEEQFKIDSAAKKAEDQWLPVFGPGNESGAQEFGDQMQRINTESAQMQELWTSIGGSVTSAFASIGSAVGGV